MKKIDGPNQVQDVGDLIMGPFGQEIDMFKGMEQTLSIANSEFKVMSFAEYAAEEKASGRKVGDGDLIAEYEDYKVESEQERSYVLEELNSELGDITRRDPRVIKADRKYGHYEFSSLQYDTEGETCSVLPYNWMCKVFNNKGEVICLTYGSLYVEVEQFCGCYDDVKYVADIESHQEISITSKYLEILENNDEDGVQVISEGPLVFIQYMQRDFSDNAIKGVGIDSVEFSLHCILNIFSAESLSVGICMGLYDYQYFKPKKKVLEKMEEQFKMFFQSDFTNFFRYDLMTFPNGI